MLEVVGHTRGIQRIVLAACVDIHGTIDLRLVVILAHHDFQAVVEVIGFCLKARLCGNQAANHQGDQKQDCFFHG